MESCRARQTNKISIIFLVITVKKKAHTFCPTLLWKNEERFKFNNKFVNIHQNLATELYPNASETYVDFSLNDYAPALMHTKTLDFLSKIKE